jgi:uncharacterized protein (DUF1501 family)
MNRRQFFHQLSLFSASTLVSIGTHAWATRTMSAIPNSQRLIVIFLRGAVDGLNVVVPYTETAYYQARPRIAIPQPSQERGALNLDGKFGLHPALAPLMPLWNQKTLAFVHASGSPESTRSHFDAQEYIESGTPGKKSTQDGWMNRLLSVMTGRNPIQAVTIGAATPRILAGKMPVATIASGRRATRALPIDKPRVAAAFDNLYKGNDALSVTYREGREAREVLLNDFETEMMRANNGAPLPNGFASDAQRLARLMVNDSRIELAFMALGGWDTHVNQGASQGQLAARLQQLGNGLVSLQKGLGNVYKDTTILVMSEFGRTVRENGNGGTDHGYGNVMWVLSGGIRGGKVYGEWPGLSTTQLHEGRDLRVTTDFRDVVITILERQMRLDTAKVSQVFPGYSLSRRIQFV